MLLAFILVPLLSIVGGLLCLELIRLTGLLTTNETTEYFPGSPVPEWKSKTHMLIGAVITALGMLVTFAILLFTAGLLVRL